jgi:Tfp pilus assembly protein PilW
MAMLVAGMGSLVTAVHATNAYCRGQAVAAQHARVALDRIDRAVRQATASGEFPGCIVVTDTIGGFDFPDTLVVWSPTTTAATPAGLPRVNELAVYCPDPAAPSTLAEIRSPNNTNACPAVADEAAWATLVASIQTSETSVKVPLTDRLRTATIGGGGTGDLRGCVRFEVLMAPSVSQWSQYRGGTRAWQDIAWPLDCYSTKTGMRRVACQTELQILPGDSSDGQTAAPFFGSSTLTYELSR